MRYMRHYETFCRDFESGGNSPDPELAIFTLYTHYYSRFNVEEVREKGNVRQLSV